MYFLNVRGLFALQRDVSLCFKEQRQRGVRETQEEQDSVGNTMLEKTFQENFTHWQFNLNQCVQSPFSTFFFDKTELFINSRKNGLTDVRAHTNLQTQIDAHCYFLFFSVWSRITQKT